MNWQISWEEKQIKSISLFVSVLLIVGALLGCASDLQNVSVHSENGNEEENKLEIADETEAQDESETQNESEVQEEGVLNEKNNTTGKSVFESNGQIPKTELTSGNETQSGQGEEKQEAANQTIESNAVAVEEKKILIAYFTWADNTVVEDADAAIQSALSHYESVGDNAEYEEVDAVSSASVIQPGNVARLAAWIQEETGGSMFSIQVTEPYSSDYDECLDRAADEKAENARPVLSGSVSDMDEYDVIFLGYPNWWYTCPMAIFSFIEQYDLSGKTIIPFCAHGTGGLARSVQDITNALPNSDVLEAIGLYRNDILDGKEKITDWINSLEF